MRNSVISEVMHTNLGGTLMHGGSNTVLVRVDCNSLVRTVNGGDHNVIAANLVAYHGERTKLTVRTGVDERDELIGTDARHLFV